VGRLMMAGIMMAAPILSGCAVVSTIAAVPEVLVQGAVDFFHGQEESLPVSMQTSLVSVQQGLRTMKMDVDVLESVKEGYVIGFGHGTLDGTVELKRQTPMLTTISVAVHQGIGRQKSVEQAIIKEVRNISGRTGTDQRFDFRGYQNIRLKPSTRAERIGWFRPGALLKAKKAQRAGWIKVRMPSGGWGYLKGSLPG